MNFCAFDIETVPNWDLPKECIPQFNPDSVKLGNVKDQSKIDAKLIEERNKFQDGLIKKMSLDPDLCQVVCLGTWDEVDKHVITTDTPANPTWDAWEWLTEQYFKHIPLVTFNGISFDLPVLWHSAIRLGIPVDPRMYKDLTKKYENRYHYDLMQIMAGWDRTKYKSFDFYLRWLGLEAKSGDGSMVYEWWQKKDYESIRKYCEQDVNMLVKLWEKIEPYIREKEE